MSKKIDDEKKDNANLSTQSENANTKSSGQETAAESSVNKKERSEDKILQSTKETPICDESTQQVSQNNIATSILDDESDDNEDDITYNHTNIEEQITTLIATGHMFKAHAIAKKAFNKNPDNVELAQAYALVLLKTGAVEESRKLIYQILGMQPQMDEATGKMMLLVDNLRKSNFVINGNSDIIAGVGLIFKESWKYSRHCRDLELSRELYLASFERRKKTGTGMNAAWLSWLTGDDAQAKSLSSEVLKLLPPFGLEASFAELIDLAEAQLLLGREDDACKLYEEAMKQSDKVGYIAIVTARQQLYFLREAGFKVPNKALEILTPPTIVVFTGHLLS